MYKIDAVCIAELLPNCKTFFTPSDYAQAPWLSRQLSDMPLDVSSEDLSAIFDHTDHPFNTLLK